MYRPFHLIGLELNVSILKVALRGEATGEPPASAATSSRPPSASWPRARHWTAKAATASVANSFRRPTVCAGGLPIGLANRVPLVRDVPKGQPVTWDDVRIDTADEAYRYRRAMETAFSAG